MKAIPTTYRGHRFRSRLEARWAAMFDLLEWPWEYEPFDLDGWAPDFALLGQTTVLVEVKPVFEFPVEVAEEIWAACPKMTSHDDDGLRTVAYELLIVGATLPVPGWDAELDAPMNKDERGLGWITSHDLNFGTDWFGTAEVSRTSAGTWALIHTQAWFGDRISGEHPGDGLLCLGKYNSQLKRLWGEAGQRVQWKGAR